jgi:hypothetical protein
VAYFGDDAVVGCASGELYRFKNGSCVQVVQAHGVKEPVLSIAFNPREGVLVTGGKVRVCVRVCVLVCACNPADRSLTSRLVPFLVVPRIVLTISSPPFPFLYPLWAVCVLFMRVLPLAAPSPYPCMI